MADLTRGMKYALVVECGWTQASKKAWTRYGRQCRHDLGDSDTTNSSWLPSLLKTFTHQLVQVISLFHVLKTWPFSFLLVCWSSTIMCNYKAILVDLHQLDHFLTSLVLVMRRMTQWCSCIVSPPWQKTLFFRS